MEYEKIRQELYSTHGSDYVDDNSGQILDWVLTALIIRGELGNLPRTGIHYLEAVEAVSNEYHAKPGGEPGRFNGSNIQCGGSCTVAEQIAWLSDVEAWYSGRIYNDGYFVAAMWSEHVSIAQQATSPAGFCHRSPCDSWIWGDVAYSDSQLVLDQTTGKAITYKGLRVVAGTERASEYPGRDIWFVTAAGPFWP